MRILAAIEDVAVRAALTEAGFPVHGHLPIPAAAYEAARRQFDAEVLLEAFLMTREENPRDGGADREPVVVVTSGDLFLAGHPHVFGAARAEDGVAVVSTARLPTPAHLRSVIAHELGHLAGLDHCSGDCAMRRARTSAEVLERPASFCTECAGAGGQVLAALMAAGAGVLAAEAAPR